MISLLGRFLLSVAFFAALACCVLWLQVARGVLVRGAALLAARLAFAGVGGAAALLEYALIRHDFGVRFVADNGSRATPLYYTVTSMWAALDGSLLLWLLILTGYLLLVAAVVPRGAERLQPWAAAVISAVALFFAGLVLFSGHAFEEVHPVPADGPGPNPLLADNPAMGVHPPLLYAGLLGLCVPFAYAVAALITGECGPAWLAATRRATVAAWTLLTAGIALGAWWSYAVLGWGGYWSWDPVENASLLPWLVATALLHAALVQRRVPGALRLWTVILATSAFLFVCVEVFLTRSGAVTSVHAFARAGIGQVLGVFVLLVAAGVGVLTVRRAERLGGTGSLRRGLNRESVLIAHQVVIGAITAIVAVGTLHPVALDLAGGGEVAVGPPYFNRLVPPVAVGLLALMTIGPRLRWGADAPRNLARRLAMPAATGLVTVAVLGLGGVHGTSAVLTLGVAAAAVVAAVIPAASASRPGRRRAVGGALAHLGVAVAALGITASSVYAETAERTLAPGQSWQVAGTDVRLVSLADRTDRRWESTTATLALGRPGSSPVRTSLRYSPEWGMTTSAPAIQRHWAGDVYLTLLQVTPDGGATVRVGTRPMIGLVWGGAVFLVAGGAVAALARPRRRTAVPPATVSTVPEQRVGVDA